MKVFLAMPYSQLCDDNYEVKSEYKFFFKKLTREIKKIKCEYFLAHERENWGKSYTSDTESTLIDFKTIKDVDLVCVIPGNPISGGVHVEMGWASANNKVMKIFLKNGADYSPMVTGMKCLTYAKYIYYDNDYSDELVDLITREIKKYKKEVDTIG